MTIENFSTEFVTIFDDEEITVSPSTIFKELDDWDSLAALSLIALIDEQYSVTISGDDIRNANSVEDLYQAVVSKMN